MKVLYSDFDIDNVIIPTRCITLKYTKRIYPKYNYKNNVMDDIIIESDWVPCAGLIYEQGFHDYNNADNKLYSSKLHYPKDNIPSRFDDIFGKLDNLFEQHFIKNRDMLAPQGTVGSELLYNPIIAPTLTADDDEEPEDDPTYKLKVHIPINTSNNIVSYDLPIYIKTLEDNKHIITRLSDITITNVHKYITWKKTMVKFLFKVQPIYIMLRQLNRQLQCGSKIVITEMIIDATT